MPEPEFEGQTKTRLGNPEVRQAVDAVVGEKLLTFFEWNPQVHTVNTFMHANTKSGYIYPCLQYTSAYIHTYIHTYKHA